jgi:hypothetical protein
VVVGFPEGLVVFSLFFEGVCNLKMPRHAIFIYLLHYYFTVLDPF